ncbi:MAG: FctA domain-containing protein, partial [Saccharofermentanales bacterium]
TLANTQWFEGASITFNPGPGTITVDYEIVDGQVGERSITFQDPSTWTQFIYGTHSNLKYIFRNTHIGGLDPVTLTFSGRKILSGRDLGSDEFQFELYESDETGAEGDFISSTWNMADGSFVFDPIVYSILDIAGTYYFLIREVDGALPGVTYDDSEFLVTVNIEVIANGISTVNVSVNYRRILGEGEFGPPVALEFYNEYMALDAETSIAGRKVLDGRELEDEEFEFALYEADAMGVVPEGAMPLMTTSNFGQSWSFPLVYPQGSDGTYYYVVREIDNELDGVTYDESDLFYTVEVWDDMEGQMMAMIVESPEVPVFYNEFEPEPVSAAIRGLKELLGRELEDDEFEFALYLADSEGMVEEGAEPIQITSNQGINWMFILSYDAEGTYYYVVREIPEDDDDDDDDDGFIVYDDSEFFFEVMVWESDGSLFTQVGSPIDREFNNRYVRPDIEVEKMVEETTFSNVGDMLHYSFSVENTGNVPLVKLIVNDEKLGIEDLVIELSEALEVGETFTFEFSEPYVVTAADIEDADPIENTLTVMAETEDGYSAEDSDEAIVAFEMRLPLPPTGEAISYWHVIALMALAAVAIGTAVLYRRKRVKSQSK